MVQEALPAVLLNVQFRPVWAQISPLQQYVQTWVSAQAPKLSARTELVLQELLENAVKYGDRSSNVKMELRIDGGRQGVELKVSNKAHPKRMALLKQELESMSTAEGAKDAFSRALERAKSLPPGISKLGLARIVTEAEVDLKILNEYVTLTAAIR